MNPKSVLLAALLAGLLPVAAVAQSQSAAVQHQTAPAAPAAAAAPAAQAPVLAPPSAFPARIGLIMFEQAVYATNEGQAAVEEVRKKFQPQKDKIDAQAAEIDSLKKALQAAPATLPDAERAAKLKVIDTKDTQYQHDAEDAQNAFNADMQASLGKVAQKFDGVMKKYATDNGYTLLLNAGDQQSPVLWATEQPNADITDAVVAAYNAANPVAPQAPPATPSATRAKPATTTPHAAAPKPAATAKPAAN